MKGLDAEFERFRHICLFGKDDKETHSAKLIFMAGALAASARILGIIDAELPDIKRRALLRRVAREAERFKQSMANQPEERT